MDEKEMKLEDEAQPQEAEAPQALEQELEQAPMAERPVWHRVFAGVLAALVIIGVIGYYYWIMRG